MEYEWDSRKAAENRSKHGIDFADAVLVLEDPLALTMADEHPQEDRAVTIGEDGLGRLLVVVYTMRGEDVIRIISAREATRRERAEYEEGRK